MVGAGLVGLSIAWWLLGRGHRVTLLDPAIDGPPPADGGSWAALGVLMAQVFHRSSGRGWRLRQRSHQLWGEWIGQLAAEGLAVPRRQGLLLLAADAAERAHQERLVASRQAQGMPLSLWSGEQLQALHPWIPAAATSALHSAADGQLDPPALLAALLTSARRRGLRTLAEAAVSLERCGGGSGGGGWRLQTGTGSRLDTPWLVLSAGLGTAALLASAGHPLALEPVLGQALELELAEPPPWSQAAAGMPEPAWPGVVVWRGLNLVPRPDLPGGRRCWLGATLEPGDRADATALARLRRWGGDGPAWLERARVVRRWQGHRCKPSHQPAPVLEHPEPGLLVASGHYRNGVLLAPATAAWVAEQIETGSGEAG